MSLLVAEALCKSFAGLQAVDAVSFRLAAGEVLALIGPNGAGKSTCFNLINGQLRPDTGRVIFDNQDITGAAPRALARRGIARTFQIAATFASMSARENVQMALIAQAGQVWRFLRPARAFHADAADAILAQLGMAALGDRPAASLAYGDLKRLELAIALAGAPRLLLMDEPSAGMAPAERGAMMELIRELAHARGIAVLFTEHDMGAVFATAERILVMDRGQLIAEGTPREIRANPRVRAVYLGEDA